ncbi:MAG: RNA polymerase sigma-70 factor [Chitinophagaceae bacterium]|nr:RNA polymerase sigma-70 factor [Chitinophagaceae bacterium]
MPNAILYNEKSLLISVANGDEAAYKELYIQYWDYIYSAALMFIKSPQMAEDIAQDVFAAIWLKREKLRDVVRFESYLFIAARNLIYDRFRQKIFTPSYELSLIEYFHDKSYDPLERITLKEMEIAVHKGVAHLPKLQQTAFRLSRFQGLNHEEIAERMGISKQNVKSNIVRAISNLRKRLSTTVKHLPFILLACFPQ